MNALQEALWKQRFETLKSFLDDAVLEIKHQGFEKSPKRAWDPIPKIYVSFAFDVVDSYEKAVELFGEGCFDTYQLVETGRES